MSAPQYRPSIEDQSVQASLGVPGPQLYPSTPSSPQLYHTASSPQQYPATIQSPSGPQSIRSPSTNADYITDDIPLNDVVPPYSGPSTGSPSFNQPPVSAQRAYVQPLPFSQPSSSASPGRTSSPPQITPNTQAKRSNPLGDPRTKPTLPQIPPHKFTPTEKTMVLQPLPYGWSLDCPEGDTDPALEVMFSGKPPAQGYQNVLWTHAYPALDCDGRCNNERRFHSRIRYTCVTCKPGSTVFNLCETCFATADVGSLHNPNHELYKMDLAFPDWSHPAWHRGIKDLEQVVKHIGSKTWTWADKGNCERGDKYMEQTVKRMFIGKTVVKPEIVEMDGMEMSMTGFLHVLIASEKILTEVTFRSSPSLSGVDLAKMFIVMFEKLPDAFPKLHTIRAIGCNFFDFRHLDPSKRVDYAKRIQDLFDKSYTRQDAAHTEWINAQMEEDGGGCCGLFGGSSKNIGEEPYVRPACKVIFSVCDGVMNTPCGFPGLPPAVWWGGEPDKCYNKIRDKTLGVVEYLGDPERLMDPVEERKRVLNKRKAREYAHMLSIVGGVDKLTEETNRKLNEHLDKMVSQF
ncbi:hypothetical protein CPC16_004386 [Podila verticillata]|nr:hypothetical protein BGZ59_004620 [Podila verticillata]KAF9391387.1 hypothetical protein CPC16_004386 [Podila verticillata]KFH67132.1 hypothetical protein MVEG_07655 [Podila verticillata NRRL 6337]